MKTFALTGASSGSRFRLCGQDRNQADSFARRADCRPGSSEMSNLPYPLVPKNTLGSSISSGHIRAPCRLLISSSNRRFSKCEGYVRNRCRPPASHSRDFGPHIVRVNPRELRGRHPPHCFDRDTTLCELSVTHRADRGKLLHDRGVMAYQDNGLPVVG